MVSAAGGDQNPGKVGDGMNIQSPTIDMAAMSSASNVSSSDEEGSIAGAAPSPAPGAPLAPSQQQQQQQQQQQHKEDTIQDGDRNDNDEVTVFLKHYPDSPGAKFIRLWTKYRGTPEDEVRRLLSCTSSANDGVCLGGDSNYQRTVKSFKHAGNHQPPLSSIPVPLWDGVYSDNFSKSNKKNKTLDMTINVEKLRYVEDGKVIPQLGTTASCIPLMLAGYAALSSNPTKGIIVELGPFAGFSSRCIVAGMKYYGHEIEHSYVALDTFEELKNYKAISNLAKWTTKENPNFTQNNTNFLWLWEKNVQSIYPPAIGRPGWINKMSLNPDTLWNKTVTMISIDSAKNPTHLVTQLEGILPITVGTILFLMDFGSARLQVQQIFPCLRPYLIPYYAHDEQWAFVVQKDIHGFSSDALASCYQDLAEDTDGSLLNKTKSQLRNDFKTTLGIDPDKITSPDVSQFVETRLYSGYTKRLENSNGYKTLASFAKQKAA